MILRRNKADYEFHKLGYNISFVNEEERELTGEVIHDSDLFVRYSKYVPEYKYNHYIDLLHKASGEHIIQSHDENENMVGLEPKLALLAIRKMKEKGWIR